MKATGIVRRIDDLGRVVIPKEIRRTMRINTEESKNLGKTNEKYIVYYIDNACKLRYNVICACLSVPFA